MCKGSNMSDEGFHEFQLNGKQLVFLFMTATVVAVVIFLCGVMVGRGVPVRAASAIDVPGRANLDPTAAVQEPPAVPTAAGADNEPVAAQETLTYPGLLKDSDPPEDTLRPPVEPTSPTVAEPSFAAARQPDTVALRPPSAVLPAATAPLPVTLAPPVSPAPSAPSPPPVSAAPRPATRPAATAPETTAAAAAFEEPLGAGFVVQVAAVRQRAEANTIARRLSAKGYPAFVTTAGANFRVRVGKYTDRREAESVAGRLEKEERFTPWITR